MLPEHPTSGYCDLQGRRPTIEDFHSIHLKHDHQFYGMFDGHTGNLASKFAASELYGELMRRLPNLENMLTTSKSEGEGVIGDEKYSWKEDIRINITQAFEYVHDQFLDRITTMTSPIVEVGTAPNMDQSGTTATAILVTDNMIIAATLGDSRAIISHSSKNPWKDFPSVSAVQFSIDHVASHPTERDLVIERGGFVSASGGIPRVNGILAVTRSIGDADLAPVLSREPHVLVLDRSEIRELCGSLASDGLWDVMSNQEAVDMVVDIILRENMEMYDAADGPFQEAAERLAVEAYVRGSTDNIGVCVVAVD
ncbi:protein serine/threonine phosphatase 2C [Fragilariopsis cylindrus CCMP1102]|uniref:Protein serine/threonine phosphatase 2C n=1 Tax=Fragilariopsis cylindrus CCMP1102 TaxID=635003 RepID=A0A1E7F9V3_9STRA|nr:protein serine/threonine phosphatase 2C [Fragilariopsis cylindrus CCMP1102]|eukprot:OEU14926.1 protein serine/threonine phosphatase 2C [Fragilariopsis cylindrus CCMP1102]